MLHPGLPGERRYPLTRPVTAIGRIEDNDIVLAHLSLSRRHARVEIDDGRVVLIDEGSKNGTWVNGQSIDRAVLRHGDRLRLGDIDLVFADDTRSGMVPVSEHNLPSPGRSLSDYLGPGPSGLNLPSDAGEQRDRQKLQVLLDAATELASIDTIEHILARIVQLVARLFDADRVAVLLPNPHTGALEERATWCRPPFSGPAHSHTIASFVADRRTAALFTDAAAELGAVSGQSLAGQPICSAMGVPLIARDRLHGVLYVDNLTVPARFTDEDLRFLAGFANQASLGIENALLYERIEREAALRQNLLRFFPETIAQRLMSDTHAPLEPVEGTVTALFCDLSEFVALGDGLPPRALFEVLQEYLQAISEVVFVHEGTLEKYIGDAVMAVWGAPYARVDDAARAVQAAAAMQRAMVEVNRRVARFHRELSVHIGINTGPAVAGNIGSSRYLQYAAIGDATNLAARVCAKATAGQILVTDATRLALGRAAPPLEGPFPFLPKGKIEPINTWLVPWRSMVPP